MQRRDHPAGDGKPKSVGVPNGANGRGEFRFRCKGDGRKRSVDPKKRDVACRIMANEAGREDAAIGQPHIDPLSRLDHMPRRCDKPIPGNHDAAAFRHIAARRTVRSALRPPRPDRQNRDHGVQRFGRHGADRRRVKGGKANGDRKANREAVVTHEWRTQWLERLEAS